jgi:hypothetical protein
MATIPIDNPNPLHDPMSEAGQLQIVRDNLRHATRFDWVRMAADFRMTREELQELRAEINASVEVLLKVLVDLENLDVRRP